MSTDTYKVEVTSVDGAAIGLAFTFGADTAVVSKTYSFWLMVLAEGMVAKKVKKPFAALFDPYDICEDPEISKSSEKRAMKRIQKITFGKVEGGKAKTKPRFLRIDAPADAPRPVVAVTLTLADPAHAKSFKTGAKWGGTTYDPGLDEPAFDYEADDWDDGDDDDDGDDGDD